MNDAVYITADCSVKNNQVFVNNKLVFEQKGSNAADFFEAAYRFQQSDYPRFFKMDKLSQLGTIASAFLLGSSYNHNSYAPNETGMVLSNRNASLDADLNYYKSVSAIPSPALFVYTLPNIVIGEVSIRYGFKGESAFFIAPEPDADLLHFYITDLFERGVIKACIAGWLDVVGEEYYAQLYYCELTTGTNNNIFSKENINQLYQRSWKN